MEADRIWINVMPRILPCLDATDLLSVKSSAERRFYIACQAQLPADWLVLFSTSWVGVKPSGRPYDGEADFVIFVPTKGFLVVEVKGGGVEFSPSDGWFSIDHMRTRNPIKDPFGQAMEEKHSLWRILRNDRRWGAARATRGHAVMLSDVYATEEVVSPESPYQIIGGAGDMSRLQSWILRVLDYWAGAGGGNRDGLAAKEFALAEAILCHRIMARPALSARLAEEEALRLELTEQQSRILRGIGDRRVAAISGGAGTGKTVLAAERARELATDGRRTLFVCYNHLLADYLKHTFNSTPNIWVMTFHQLCDWKISEALTMAHRDVLAEAKEAYPATKPSDLYDLQKPFALALSCEALVDRFDAIIVDEAQDFKEEFWLPIESLLSDMAQAYLYVFFDDNQSLYTVASSLPIKEAPFVLTYNCRNTQTIHALAYRQFKGPRTDPPPRNVGVPVEAISEPNLEAQALALHRAIQRLIVEERVAPEQIAVLVCDTGKDAYYKSLTSKKLPKAAWLVEGAAAGVGVRVDTVRRFKGLEADIVFLWGWQSERQKQAEELLYVGASRAKSCLTLVGTKSECERLLKGEAETSSAMPKT